MASWSATCPRLGWWHQRSHSKNAEAARDVSRKSQESLAIGEVSTCASTSVPVAGAAWSRGTLQLLKERLKSAQSRATSESALPVMHGGLSISGLTLVQALRLVAWRRGDYPPNSVFAMHEVSFLADVTGICFAFPVLFTGLKGQWVRYGYIGPILTLVVSMALVDIIMAGCIFFFRPAIMHPPHEGIDSLSFFERSLSPWDCAIIASLAFEVSLCACFWRVYRTLRIAGLYPPSEENLLQGSAPQEISPLEICCESEEVQLLQECHARDSCRPCGPGSEQTEQEQRVVDAPAEAKVQSQDLDADPFNSAGVVHVRWPLEDQPGPGYLHVNTLHVSRVSKK